MKSRTIRMTVSLPVEEYRQVEQIRRELKLPRSTVISRALISWFEALREKELVSAYVKGYERMPETQAEVNVHKSLAIRTLAEEE